MKKPVKYLKCYACGVPIVVLILVASIIGLALVNSSRPAQKIEFPPHKCAICERLKNTNPQELQKKIDEIKKHRQDSLKK